MIVTLTDFGSSEYLGVMKGVIYSINKNTKITDLFNEITPHSIKQGAWILLQNFRYFPKKSIFLCVVDPGVGSNRKPIIIETKNYYFVGPDNGLMYPAANKDGIRNCYEITNKPKSNTFHGRDIFAPTAAYLEQGEIKGSKISEIEKLEFYLEERTGEVVSIDKFGNIITNLKPLNKMKYLVNKIELNYYENYNEAPDNELFLITGSCGTLEISKKNQPANFKMKVGDRILIT